MKYIALGIYAPNPSFVWAQHFREFMNSYADGVYSGRRTIEGYFTLIRPYPDKIDSILSEWQQAGVTKQRLLEA